MRYEILCKVIAAVILFTVLARWRAISIAGQIDQGGVHAVTALLMVMTMALALATVAGLWTARRWGFLAFYPFGVLFTILFGASLIPFVALLVPVEARVAGVIAVNAAVLVLVAVLHRLHPDHRSRQKKMLS